MLPGATTALALFATGGLLSGVGAGVGVGVKAVMTVAPGPLPLLLAGLASGVADVLLAVLLTLNPERGARKLTVLATVAVLAKLATAGNVTIPVVEL